MKLGLVTDIHNDICGLRDAVDALDQLGIDQLITLGDTCDAFIPPEGSDEVAQLLLDRNALGVWGNHDYIFPHQPSEYIRSSFGPPTFEFMKTTTPNLEMENCYFSHLESSIDQHDPVALWRLNEPEFDRLASANKAFQTVPSQFQFTGHYHCWYAATPEGPLDWNGQTALDMSDGRRYFVIIRAVVQGSCALFDTESMLLKPLTL